MADQPQPVEIKPRVVIFVIVGTLSLLFFLVTTRAGDWFTPTYRLHAYISETDGISPGAAVRLSGLEIGRVDTVEVNSNRADRTNNIHVVFVVQTKFQPEIRGDSRVTFGPRSLLGDVDASISRGFEGPPLPDDSQIHFVATPQISLSTVIDKMGDCVKALPEIAKQKASETKSAKKNPIP